MAEVTFSVNERICAAGDAATALYAVIEGGVRLTDGHGLRCWTANAGQRQQHPTTTAAPQPSLEIDQHASQNS